MAYTYSKKRHKELVVFAQNLKQQGKSIWITNPKEDRELSEYDVAFEEQIFWAYRKNFLQIMKNFLDNISDFEEFETAFSILFNKVQKDVEISKRDLKKVDNFQLSTRSDRFATFMTFIFRQFEQVDDEFSTEQEVETFVKETYLKFQKFE